MISTAYGRQGSFEHWLRTGRLPVARSDDGVELKFNPWHDPDDGRFTFVGSGQYYGDGKSPARSTKDAPAQGSRAGGNRTREGTPKRKPGLSSRHQPTQRTTGILPNSTAPNPVAEFARGAASGAYRAGKGAAGGIHSALTTDPRETASNVVRELARTIDSAIAAEDTPARVQVARAVSAAKAASARDLGDLVGSQAVNAALAIAPGGSASRISAVRHARKIGTRETIPQPEFRWFKETVSEGKAKVYNDAAPGARPGKAPALKLTMPDGSERWVKFDGVTGEYPIDRKRSVYWTAKARDQAARQSAALRQNLIQATWECQINAS